MIDQQPYGQIYVVIGPADYVRYTGKHKFNAEVEGTLQNSLEIYLTKNTGYALRHPQSKRPLDTWLREMHFRGIRPRMLCIEKCYSLAELEQREIYWIAFYKEHHPDILNVSPCAVGGSTPASNGMRGRCLRDLMSPEAYEQRLRFMREVQNRPEVKASKSRKMSGAGNPMFGKNAEDFMSPEAIAEKRRRLGEAGKIAQLGNKHGLGHVVSEETRRKISEVKKARFKERMLARRASEQVA